MRVRDIPWLVVLWLSERREVEGMELRVAESPEAAESSVAKLQAALQLIAATDSRCFERIKHDVPRILLSFGTGGQYLPSLRVCRIGIDTVRECSTLELAMTLIHEATHARLWQCGIHYETALRERIEHLCVTAEVAFARKIPESQDAIERTQRLLDEQWWTDAEQTRYSLAELHRLGCPVWLIRVLEHYRSKTFWSTRRR